MGAGEYRVRPARESDKPRILEISAQVWEGRDYIPRVVDKWLHDSEGEFSVVLANDELVGYSKLSTLVPGHGWLEGARVDTAWRGRGVATALARHHIELARQAGFSSLRYATGSDNKASRTMADRLGFELAGEFYRYQAPAEPITDGHLELIGEPPPRTNHGLIPVGWTFYPWLDELIARWHNQGHCRYFGQAGAMIHQKRPGRLTMSLLWGSEDDIPDLLRGIRQQAAPIEDISYVTDCHRYREQLLAAGFEQLDIDVVVFQYPLA
ncbi:MAG: GNAT family N-acetyltransferase [Firmicutes bacterium]|nr:GNAT family N-acetyltransferase [Bacillota bacterium]